MALSGLFIIGGVVVALVCLLLLAVTIKKNRS